MTDVEAGGATVFPEIGLRLVPEKVYFQFQFDIWAFWILVSYSDNHSFLPRDAVMLVRSWES